MVRLLKPRHTDITASVNVNMGGFLPTNAVPTVFYLLALSQLLFKNFSYSRFSFSLSIFIFCFDTKVSLLSHLSQF